MKLKLQPLQDGSIKCLYQRKLYEHIEKSIEQAEHEAIKRKEQTNKKYKWKLSVLTIETIRENILKKAKHKKQEVPINYKSTNWENKRLV